MFYRPANFAMLPLACAAAAALSVARSAAVPTRPSARCRAQPVRANFFSSFMPKPPSSPADVYDPDLTCPPACLPASFEDIVAAASSGVAAALEAGLPAVEVEFPPVASANARGDGSAASERLVHEANAAFAARLAEECGDGGRRRVTTVGCTSGALSALGAGAFSLRDAVRSAPSAPYPHANCSLCTPPRPTYPLRPMHLRCPSCLAHLRCSSIAWQRHRRLGRGHLRRAVLRRAVGGSRGPERGSTSHTDAALQARVAAWRAGAAAAAAEAEGAAAAAHAAAHWRPACLPRAALPPGGREARTLPRGCPREEACSVAWCALVAAQRRLFNLRPSRCGQVHGSSGQRPAEQRSATARLLLQVARPVERSTHSCGGSGSWEPHAQPATEPATRVAGRTGLAWGIAPRIAG